MDTFRKRLENIEIASPLFTNETIETYRNNIRIKEYLRYHNVKILNKSEMNEFLAWTPVDGNLASRIPASMIAPSFTKNVYKQKEAENLEYMNDNMEVFLQEVSANICGDQISYDYGKSAMELSLENMWYDVLFLVKGDYLDFVKKGYKVYGEDSNKWDIAYYKVQCVLSFIIIQKAECIKLDDVYSVRLICSLPGVKVNVLMGAYLYVVKGLANANRKMGILELADGYKNLQGFCSYSKFGFQYDKSLYGDDCFTDKTNLPMSVNLNRPCITKTRIINTAVMNLPICVYDREDQELCTKYRHNNEQEEFIQHQLSQLYNLLYKHDLRKEVGYEKDDAEKEEKILRKIRNTKQSMEELRRTRRGGKQNIRGKYNTRKKRRSRKVRK